MRTVDEIMGRCRIDEECGHWIWTGAMSDKSGGGCQPKIYAPEYTLAEGEMRSQTGRRAVWHCLTGKAIPAGWRVYRVCTEPKCLNPAHMRCGPVEDVARHTKRTGRYRDQPRRIAANRLIGRARSKLTPAVILEIQSSSEMGIELAARLGLSDTTISKARRGEARSHQALGGLFTGLMR